MFLIEGAANTGYRAAPHDGQELRYVISGRVTFTVGQEEHTVEAGGTLRHTSTLNHGFRVEDEASTFITFALSRGYDVSALFKGTSDPVHD
ncbi:MAG: cupin domain-containing protein [Planctomycetota bacterium]